MNALGQLSGERAQALLKVLPVVSRADGPETVITLSAGGGPITEALRDELLAKCAAGEYVELDLDVLAYEQRPGVANRKHVRFRDGLMTRLGASGKNKPFLRDHLQGEALARGGTILVSKAEKRGEGDYAIHEHVRLTAPWAVEAALRGLMDRVSIGWWPTGPIECSVCGTEVFTKCYHWPGDKVTESTKSDGSKQFLRDRAGDRVVEWVFTEAELIETSFVNVPAVPGAGVDKVRAALSAAFPDLVEGDGLFADVPAATPVLSPAAPGDQSPRQQATTSPRKEPAMPADTEPKSNETEAPDVDKLATEKAKATLAAHRTAVRVVREMAPRLGVTLDADGIDKLVDDAGGDVKAAKLALLDMVAKGPGQSPINHTQVTLVADQADKRREATTLALTHRALLSASVPSIVANAKRLHPHLTIPKELELPVLTDEVTRGLRRMRLVDIAEDYLRARGIDTRHMDEVQIAELVLSGASDFPLALADVMNKVLLAPFAVRPSPWRLFSREIQFNDFKALKLIRRSSAPKMVKLKSEDAEVKYGGYSERQEEVAPETYVGGVMLTRKIIINDDLGAFAQDTLGLGESVADNRDDIVCSIFTDNAPLSDTYALFHANHNNISGTTGGDVAAVEAAEEKMAAQVETRRDGTTRKLNLNIDTWFGARKEMVEVDKLVNPNYNPAEVANGLGRMSLGKPCLYDQRLAVTPRYYYGICAARTGLVYGGLKGNANPRFSSAIDFETEGAKFKAMDDFGAGVDSWEWVVRVTR